MRQNGMQRLCGTPPLKSGVEDTRISNNIVLNDIIS